MTTTTTPSIPNEPSLESLLAEDGMCVTAGLPEEMRRDLDKLNAARDRVERGKAERERMEKLLAAIEGYEAKITELQKELADAMRAYGDVMLHRTPAA
jgi:hypothetical protein